MFSKTKKPERIDSEQREQREQYEYARKRIKQKKTLMRHFIIFVVGCVMLIILDPVLGIGKEYLGNDWFIWAILAWTFIFLIHLFNVFVMNKFMDKEWEDRQMEKLKARQAERIAQIQKEVDNEIQLPKKPDPVETKNPNLLPPDEL